MWVTKDEKNITAQKIIIELKSIYNSTAVEARNYIKFQLKISNKKYFELSQ